MPELPEVETIARGLARRVTGDVIESVWLGSKPEPLKSSAAEIAATLESRRIADVRRVGKHIVLDLEPVGVGRALLPARFFLADDAALPPFSRSKTMCLPTRRTPLMRFDSSVATMSLAVDFSGSGFDPSQTDSITSPATRLFSPRAMVSTSGSSGMKIVYRARAPAG